MAETRVERRLAAILAADIAGYSALMGADEARTVRDLKEHQAVVLPMIGEFGGRIIDTAGDGILAEFSSIVNAVESAVAIQAKMAERNATIEPERRMQFRIGINIGDVVYDEARIYGDGINVAARLEGIAEAGGICISSKVYEEVGGRIDLLYQDIGEQQLKNITRPVRAYRLRLDSIAPAATPALALPDKPSIAVLPFQNMSGDPEQEYFADGMVEDIVTGLSRIKWLFVIARNSSFAYKGRAIDVKQVGRELGVRYVLEGSVRKSADRVRITTQLIDSVTGAHVWAERYDRKYDDIFTLQDDITLSVVGTIEPSLRVAEIDRAKRKRPENLSAYDLVLQAHTDTYSRMPAQSKRALVLLERALALDPTYSLAHAFAAECHHSIFLREGMREEHRIASMRHAEAAITYGQDDATALTFAGFTIGMEGRDRATALSLFEQALSVSPSSAHTYICGSVVLAFGGQGERAIEWAELALRLSPFDPWRASAHMALALGHFQRGRSEEAVAAGRKAVQASPGFSIAYMTLAAPLAKLGRIEEAKAAAAKLLELQPGFRYGRHFAGLAVASDLAAALGDVLRTTGLAE
jgi:TolB-like protein/tetratricopeptide (TPR) repeat protein